MPVLGFFAASRRCSPTRASARRLPAVLPSSAGSGSCCICPEPSGQRMICWQGGLPVKTQIPPPSGSHTGAAYQAVAPGMWTGWVPAARIQVSASSLVEVLSKAATRVPSGEMVNPRTMVPGGVGSRTPGGAATSRCARRTFQASRSPASAARYRDANASSGPRQRKAACPPANWGSPWRGVESQRSRRERKCGRSPMPGTASSMVLTVLPCRPAPRPQQRPRRGGRRRARDCPR